MNVKDGSHATHGSTVMVKVKVFANKTQTGSCRG